jgi:hypothetical protein
VPIEKRERNATLVNRKHVYLPVANIPLKDVDDFFDTNKISSDDPLKIFLVDVRHNFQKEILPGLKEMIAAEQDLYFRKHQNEESLFRKLMRDGRTDAYPFDDWERYLKVYMLKKGGETSKQIEELFYPENYRMLTSSTRQVFKDAQHAHKLSQNAIKGNFPGKY